MMDDAKVAKELLAAAMELIAGEFDEKQAAILFGIAQKEFKAGNYERAAYRLEGLKKLIDDDKVGANAAGFNRYYSDNLQRAINDLNRAAGLIENATRTMKDLVF